ncbi:SsrA-binding protein SmpB [Aliarcobacter butzleri]|uniref:SsrA-binding protein SmpB n=1 Tax=Aliarcobacter butzleri TaxID=28197 RepID=UPI00063B0944|nr:SsrA-binding protein SmpB [Aliarcobacter butzleri]KLE07811.1 single-stranded DNA-binding protein [Aliarcobacter butzleri L354]MCG3653950.1 SsrA-binding protein SmpB [Aliarcobacter butzleri]MCG3694888.1 SsrA-binding protein SmpB [Aliarcobacter butzleri]MDN5073295.1 SsrA-binding protein SmpB [Aliarcobacter butzleri]MDN5120684.1 SsrA-binding protein SmpB [Aliarcobacter butzleri]
MANKKDTKKNLVFKNKKAFHDFTILETLEAGIVLEGSEVKAIREGRVNLKDSFVRIIKGEVFLLNAHISHLSTTHSTYRPDERRSRKLLLHSKQINKMYSKVTKDGITLVALKLYFNDKNMIKIEVATAQGKKLHDKRENLKAKTMKRETEQVLKSFK